jgi:hypothetical protein
MHFEDSLPRFSPSIAGQGASIRTNANPCLLFRRTIFWEFKRKCASNVLALSLLIYNYASKHTESVRKLQTKNEWNSFLLGVGMQR